MGKNMIDKDEYPQTAEIEARCVHMLAGLCAVVGVIDHTLRNGFQKMSGTSPKKWFKAEHLSAVRRELRQADPELVFVRDIATKYGFTRFATDYRKRFDEAPSDTLHG